MRSRAIFVVVAAAMLLLFIQPTIATVIVSCQDLGNGVAEFSYDASGETDFIRAFALDITVDSYATIESIFDCSLVYGIYPSSIVIVDGEVFDNGNPVCDADYPDTLPGLGTYGITVEMGCLFNSLEEVPPVSGSLFKIAIDWHGASAVNVNISENGVRGGITMSDPEYNAIVNLTGCTLVPEPATILLFGLGGLVLRKRRR